MIIKNGYVVDPADKREGLFDILIKGAKVVKAAKNIPAKSEKVIDAKDKIVAPGLIDMHVHLREPGREDIETVKSGTIAAVSGGLATVCTMPNTRPPIDNTKELRRLKAIIKNDALANVFVAGAVTRDREGRDLVDIKRMKKEGAAAFTDDGRSVNDRAVMSQAMKKAKDENALLISHCEDESISQKGVVNEGIVATKLGLRGLPRRAEYEFVERDIALAKKVGARVHIAHVSCRESVDIIRKAKGEGAAVTCETAPHYFSLTDECCTTYDTRTKMNPPLRSKEDVAAIIEALSDGTIDAIASDHAPHGKHEKEIEFELAAFGIIGLETSLALAIKNLIEAKKVSWPRLITLMSANPAAILGLGGKGSLSPGSDADVTIIDPKKMWVLSKGSIRSKSKNSPFIDWRFTGKATDVIVGGKVVLRDEEVL